MAEEPDARLAFDAQCRRCERLARHLEALSAAHPGYHNAPVAPFGAAAPRLLIVGLAPGAHGANATGRPFTGDHAGILLYRTLFDAGLSNSPVSRSAADGLELRGVRITNAVKCLPPQNKPTAAEIVGCNPYLAAELAALEARVPVLALGAVAHKAVLRALGLKQNAYGFSHGVEHALPDGRTLLDSYHCSRYNTQTGRLTEPMFRAIIERASRLALDP